MGESFELNTPCQRLLAIDTSTSVLTVAVMEGDRCLVSSQKEADRNHSVWLMPLIQQTLAEGGMSVGDVDGIAAGQGPGSYTGIRIGVTAAKTLAWARKLPLYGVSSLEALAYGALPTSAEETGRYWLVPLMDARRGNVYTNCCEWSDGKWQVLQADANRSLEEWLTQLREGSQENNGPKQIRFVGDVQGLTDRLSTMDWGHVTTLCVDQLLHAREVGILAQRKHAARLTEDVHHFVPEYAQLAEAEVNWLRASEGGVQRG